MGAGLAGVTAARKLGEDFRITLVDPRPNCPPVFKADKLEPDQAELLRSLGLLQTLLPQASRIREVRSYYGGKFFKVTETEQYGIRYREMVNTLRASLPPQVESKLGRVVHISCGPDLQVLTLDSGEQLTCRLVLLACGLNGELLGSLQMKRAWIQAQSIAIGFNLVPANGGPFPFDAVTCSLMTPRTGIDYISLFPIADMLRANLFAFPRAGSTWPQRLVRDPNRELPRILPNLSNAIGEYRIEGKMEASITHLYRTEGEPPDGVVLIGDAAENVCPATGTGITKILTDVSVLLEHVPHWFATPGMSKQKLHSYFADPRKIAADGSAVRAARYRRNACSERSLKWRVHRLRLHLSRQLKRA
ncbi:MAG TPA: hypothetical protein VKQ11_04070 [Candidatus Sulfotelmatobacter sp.]|nr:hypothetical protein [Candidatus Sulfotelmatobacter sp.]